MVLKSSSVLSCLLPARLGFGSHHKRDSPSQPRDQEKHVKGHPRPAGPPHRHPAEPEPGPLGDDLYRAAEFNVRADPPDLPRARANTAPSDLLSPPPIPDGGIGESPGPAHRSLGTPNRSRRTSCTTFFAFSSKRRSAHGPPIVHIPQFQPDVLIPSQSVHGRWLSDASQTHAHLINPSSVPSPLQTDEEEYYYSYYPSCSSPRPDAPDVSPSKRFSSRRQDLVGNLDLDSQRSSPVNSRLSHTHIRHPYAYSNPLASIAYSNTSDIAPPLRHVSSQPLQHLQDSRTDVHTGLRKRSSQIGRETSRSHPSLSQRQLKTSVSTPNLSSGTAPVRPRSVIKKKPPKPKGSDRLLSAETWWDALLSPSPRFKARQAPHSHTATPRNCDPVAESIEGDANRNMGVTFPSAPPPRPRAASITSVASNTRPTHFTLTRSRSAADLLGRPSTSATPRAGFEPASETLVDEPAPTIDQIPCCGAGLPLPEPPLSLAQVLDDGEAFEQQRAQWKQQAAKSLGNRHSRSISRARSKSLGAKHAHGHHTSESSKAQFNFEFFAARTLLGSQSTMPTVHITQPSDSSSHLKSYSHSHSHSACSCSHTSHSRAYSHSHSHSLTTSNSSKSSRNLLPRGHSRNGSRSKPAFLKAGVLCGIGQDESHITSADEEIPSCSRAGVQSVARMGGTTNVEVSPPQSVPSSEVGIAITSSPLEGSFDVKGPGCSHVSGPRHREGDQESHWLSRHTHKSFEYAGPHPSAVDSNLAQLGIASHVSLRHRLPPRAAIHPIPHPYRSATAQLEEADDKGSDGAILRATEGEEATSPATERTLYPHLSLNHADFGQYGVGEALVYASYPSPEGVSEIKQTNEKGTTTLAAELLPLGERLFTPETVDAQPEELDTSSLVVDSPPSLTNSTVQMVMSALDNPDHLDEFKDLFYKPHPTSRDQYQEPSVVTNRVSTDVCSSVSSSPLIHLVRKLSEGIQSQGDASRTPSDSTHFQNELQNFRSDEDGTKFVFMDLARSSSSSPPIESSSQTYLPIQKGSESTAQPVPAIPEDVNSFYATSVSESPLEENENDTFGYPIKRGQFEAATAPSPIQSSTRLSTHLSIQEDRDGESENDSLSPVITWHGLSPADALRSSYLTVSDVSQMSALSDFPLPPSMQLDGPDDQMSILQAYLGATPSPEPQSDRQGENESEMGQEDQCTIGEGCEEPAGDVDATLRVLRTTSRITSFESRRSTFGGSDDMEFITHQANA